MDSVQEMLKKLVQPFAYLLYSLSKDRYRSKRLKEGVSAVVVAKNESYSLPLALESLIGFADEIICIDNGSTDDTLQKMHQFKNNFSGKVTVQVIEMPDATLCQCRNSGLYNSNFNWHLRWDADMVFRQTTGEYNANWLREIIKRIRRPVAIKLSRINLSGDLHHVSKLYDVVDDGEYFLVRRTNSLKLFYGEINKFDLLHLPLFYKIIEINEPFIFHLGKLKSLDRILYRNEYFNWRKEVVQLKSNIDFETFRKEWEMKMFGTPSHEAALYRFHKKFVFLNSVPFDVKKYGPYPEAIQRAIDTGNERFSFIFENGKAITRDDKEDSFLNNYIPTKEDLEWNLEGHLKKVLSTD